MRKMVIGLALIALCGCTNNIRSRVYGGSMTVELPAGQKLVNATWKNANLWYLTRPMHAGEHAETLTFQESSAYGVMNGTVTFNEHDAARP